MKATLTILFFLLTHELGAQVVLSEQVIISFFSEAPLEDIRSESREGVSALDLATREIYFKVPVRSFNFEKRLMQEHFNENYMESDKYPYAEFRGNIQDQADFSKDGAHPVTIKGNLNIHGVTRPYTVKGELKVNSGKINAKAVFPVHLVDHQVKIPRLVIKNIAEVVEVTVSVSYKPPTRQE